MGVIVIGVAAILFATLLPSALSAFYKQDTNAYAHMYDISKDANGKTIAANLNYSDTATTAIWKLLPLFATLGGMAVLVGVGLKEYGYI